MGRRPPAVRQLAERDLDRARHDAVLAPLVLVTHVEGVAVGLGEGLCVECPIVVAGTASSRPIPASTHAAGPRQHAGEPVVPIRKSWTVASSRAASRGSGGDQRDGGAEGHEPADVRGKAVIELDVERSGQMARRELRARPAVDDVSAGGDRLLESSRVQRPGGAGGPARPAPRG